MMPRVFNVIGKYTLFFIFSIFCFSVTDVCAKRFPYSSDKGLGEDFMDSAGKYSTHAVVKEFPLEGT